MALNPAAVRGGILFAELTIFFTVTALATYFLSHAGAMHFSKDEKPSDAFPVLAYDGDRGRPDPKHYVLARWGEWEGVAGRRPGATLLLPERAGNLQIEGGTRVQFASEPEGDGRQRVELRLSGGGTEQQVRYVAEARRIEPLYHRMAGTNTFLMGALIGFVCGMLGGRAMRRRWLRPPGAVVHTPPAKGN
jgi:hypothetical protein